MKPKIKHPQVLHRLEPTSQTLQKKTQTTMMVLLPRLQLAPAPANHPKSLKRPRKAPSLGLTPDLPVASTPLSLPLPLPLLPQHRRLRLPLLLPASMLLLLRLCLHAAAPANFVARAPINFVPAPVNLVAPVTPPAHSAPANLATLVVPSDFARPPPVGLLAPKSWFLYGERMNKLLWWAYNNPERWALLVGAHFQTGEISPRDLGRYWQ
ncbi:MAG: hypothetical protein Q9166_002777 [cf. Caloplaca sp. 2 TL-2023]